MSSTHQPYILAFTVSEEDTADNIVFVCSPVSREQIGAVDQILDFLDSKNLPSSHITSLFSHTSEIRNADWNADGMMMSKEEFTQIRTLVGSEKLHTLFLSEKLPRPTVDVFSLTEYNAKRFGPMVFRNLFAFS